MGWYKVEHWSGEELVSTLVFSSWQLADAACDNLEENFPGDDIRLWVRER